MKYYKGLIIFLSLFIFISIGISLEWKSVGPCARQFSSLAVDSINQRIILFGGGCPRLPTMWSNDVWEMNLDTVQTTFPCWVPVSVSGTLPAGRGGHVAAYDPTQQRLIMFGGDIGWGNRVNEVWALNLNAGNESWERLNPTGTPPGVRSVSVGFYHPTRNSVIIFSGDGNSTWYNDVWELRLDSLIWQEISITGTRPSGRGSSNGFFDAINNRMIIFGGLGSGVFYNDLWALDLTVGNESWTQLSQSGQIPQPRSGYAYGYSSIANKFYIYGGAGDMSVFGDLFVLDVIGLSWTQLYPSGQGPRERRTQTGVFDYFNDNFIIFGGNYPIEMYFGDTYLLNVSSVGTEEFRPAINLANDILIVNSPAVNSCAIQFIVSNPQKIKVRIIDITGRIVKTLYSGYSQSTGISLIWDGTDENGEKMNSGTYICELGLKNESLTKKFVFTTSK